MTEKQKRFLGQDLWVEDIEEDQGRILVSVLSAPWVGWTNSTCGPVPNGPTFFSLSFHVCTLRLRIEWLTSHGWALDKVQALNQQNKGTNIEGTLSHLRFADDIVLVSTLISKLTTMIEQLHHASTQIGLEMNLKKTKIMSAGEMNITIDNLPQTQNPTGKREPNSRNFPKTSNVKGLKDKVPNEKIRLRTQLTDVLKRGAQLKWRWAGHVAR
ncbi:hypothetical protein ILUMI_26461 [Ignelater luminosus]|uniref:Reverse transcriptase domain-containing protein n=1 Tax=Ignelater luminosus TaxID=2038154 RepID=A0A8K0C6P2_IGNLU|nr:hypothetical protein ILUMI_26461 [Ignelater luminosus]